MVKKIALFLIVAYLMFNFLVSYVTLNNSVLLLFMILGFVSGLLLTKNLVRLNVKQKSLILVIAICIEGLILLISAFIFESGYVLESRRSLFEVNKLISLYCTIGVLIIRDCVEYIISKKKM